MLIGDVDVPMHITSIFVHRQSTQPKSLPSVGEEANSFELRCHRLSNTANFHPIKIKMLVSKLLLLFKHMI